MREFVGLVVGALILNVVPVQSCCACAALTGADHSFPAACQILRGFCLSPSLSRLPWASRHKLGSTLKTFGAHHQLSFVTMYCDLKCPPTVQSFVHCQLSACHIHHHLSSLLPILSLFSFPFSHIPPIQFSFLSVFLRQNVAIHRVCRLCSCQYPKPPF